MTNRDGQRVRRVIRSGDILKPQQEAHHLLDLFLVCPAVSGDGLLYLERRIFADIQPCLGQRQEQDATRLSHDDGRARVCAEKELFDRRFVGMVFIEESRHRRPTQALAHLPLRVRTP